LPSRFVVFDTNAYRRIAPEAIEGLKQAERRCGIVACASAIVAIELLAHLADKADPEFGHCAGALRKMRAHTRLWDGREFIPFVGTARDALSQEWFGVPDRTLYTLTRGLGGVIARVADGTPDADGSLRDYCNQARTFVTDGENRYGTMLQEVVTAVRGEALATGAVKHDGEIAKANSAFHREHGLQFAAEIIARNIAGRVGTHLEGDALARCAATVLEVMPVSAAFLRNELNRYSADGADPALPANRNGIWDLEHCGHAARQVTPVDCRILGCATPLLVTDDHRIRVAAGNVECKHLVMSLCDYQRALADGTFLGPRN
jgi:hypothetical protein